MSTGSLIGGGTHPGDLALYRGKVGLVCFFVSEAHMFGALIIAYLVFLPQTRAYFAQVQQDQHADVLHLPLALFGSACLFSSSATMMMASRELRRGAGKAFHLWWLATIVLGLFFLVYTGLEWRELIVDRHLTLGLNHFGTAYFSLVGLHATHVTIGVVLMSLVLGLALGREITPAHATGAELVAWYWHFVDAVWVVIFILVYLVSP
jgi:cytochrome c oxidase subunit 3